MKKRLILLAAITCYLETNAQTGIGTQTVNPSSILEVSSTNKGVLLPRIALIATNNPSPLTANVAGMIAYNSAISGTGPNQVIPGYYYNDGSSWLRFSDKLQISPWYNVSDNLPATGLVQDIYQTGKIGIFTNSPTHALHVTSATAGTDPVKIEGLKTVGASESELVIDNSGIIRTSSTPPNALFFAKLKTDQDIIGTTVSAITLLYDTPLNTSATYSYDSATGVMTFNEVGNYIIAMQTAFIKQLDKQQLTTGVRELTGPDYLARGTKYAPKAYITSASIIGQIMQFTTMITVSAIGYQVKFTAASKACTVLATESGTSGDGNVTNISIQKI